MLQKFLVVEGEDEFYIRDERRRAIKNRGAHFNCVIDEITTSYIGLLTYRPNFGAPAAVCESLENFLKKRR